jgi:hypothetical protein
MDLEDIDNLDNDYDAMEPIPTNNDNDPYTKHLVLPIKQIIRQKTPSMTFQTPIKQKKISYDDILASMNLYVKDGALHKINKTEGIKIAPYNPTPKPKPLPPPTQEEMQKMQQARRKALHLNYLRQMRLRAQIAASKSKRIQYINNTSHLELDSHTAIHVFKLIGK